GLLNKKVKASEAQLQSGGYYPMHGTREESQSLDHSLLVDVDVETWIKKGISESPEPKLRSM
ncbi:hypothetical protein HAX54_003067, partial [Datura stramonium]|nr:hypothetical protein [Datura stramonium]